MVAWATSGKFQNTAFLCICVDPNALGTAKEFAQLYFPSAPASLVNGYIDDRGDFPNFQAQLGCQGFIIFNAAHQIVAKATLAFMQYRDHAFRDVEARLFQILQPSPPENPLNAPVGQHVRIINLTSDAGKALNGQLGEVVGSSANGRFLLKIGNDSKSMRPENLEDATDAPIGKKVQVSGLTSEKGLRLNGQMGEIIGGTASGRYIVRLAEATMSLQKQNLQDVQDEEIDVTEYLKGVESVGHNEMDAQHDLCTKSLRDLSETLSVQSLHQVRHALKDHFDEEEELLTSSGFGGAGAPNEDKALSNDFSALGSHIGDHNRIIAMVDEALSKLQNVCEKSDAYGGTVPKRLVCDLCTAFVDHASLYDSLYVGKLGAHASESEIQEMCQPD